LAARYLAVAWKKLLGLCLGWGFGLAAVSFSICFFLLDKRHKTKVKVTDRNIAKAKGG
jgi:hypothetical protein